MIQSPRKSLRRLSTEKNVPYRTCQRIVRRYLNMFPYHIQRLQILTQRTYFHFVTSRTDHPVILSSHLRLCFSRWFLSLRLSYHKSRIGTMNVKFNHCFPPQQMQVNVPRSCFNPGDNPLNNTLGVHLSLSGCSSEEEKIPRFTSRTNSSLPLATNLLT
jgi:hypothetical protein